MERERDADDGLADLFWAVARRLRHASTATLEPLGVTPGHGRALAVLHRHGPMRLSAFAEHLRIAPRSATEVADALAERGLAVRAPDPADRRAVLLSLTDDGEATARAVHEARHREAAALFGTLSGEDREALAAILRRLADPAPTSP